MTKPLVSIIIPTLNRAHLIGETLDSVIAQTYQNWECIVVDDGSTDNTEELMADYIARDPRFQFHHRPKDRLPGGNAARNYGFEVSKGEFINFLDSDDCFHPKKIELKIKFKLDFDCDVVISKHTKNQKELLRNENIEPRIFKSRNFDIDFILSRNQILIGDPMIERDLIEKVRFDEQLRRGQDHEFFIRLFRNSIKYCFLDVKLYLIKVTPRSITLNAGQGDKDMIRTQILIHKTMIEKYSNVPEVVFEYERKTQKMYRSLVQKKKFLRIIEHYHFYRTSFKLNNIEFVIFFILTSMVNRGFDKMKKNIT